MKQSDYPIIISGRYVYPQHETLYWNKKDICIIGKDYAEYNGDIEKLIRESINDDESKEYALSILDEIKEQYEIYHKWDNSLDLKDTSANLMYYPIRDFEAKWIGNGYDEFRTFVDEEFHVRMRFNDAVNIFISNMIQAHIISYNAIVYAYNYTPFMSIHKESIQNGAYTYSIIDEEIFYVVYDLILNESKKATLDRLLENSQPTPKHAPYIEDVNFNGLETRYVYINGEFVEYDEDKHSMDEPKFKKMIGEDLC